ncbi:MAG: hypothetical protein WC538_22700 [Thermoanaerobaculia bacterium]|jgi:hypothetical protein
MFEIRQVDDFSEADASNLIAGGLAREATKQEAERAKAAAKEGQSYVHDPKSPMWADPALMAKR